MHELKTGDRVRIAYEGTIKKATPEIVCMRMKDGTSSWFRRDVLDGMEVVEPGYEDGSMYIDAAGMYWQYFEECGDDSWCWLSPGSTHQFSFSIPRRPLRRLAPEVKLDADSPG